MPNKHKYTMKLSLNVLRHLGLNLYSNIPAVISELVANAYDADATEVTIDIKDGEDQIIIEDNGHGMTLNDINEKFLNVGYARRKNNEEVSPKYRRPVMGRKGIGKLSIFSIANKVYIHTKKEGNVEKHGFILNRWKIEDEIKKGEEYHPEDIPKEEINIKKGTKLILTDFKKNINYASSYLRRRLARRFSVLGKEHKFSVCIDGKPVTLDDRDFFNRVQFVWYIGEKEKEISNKFDFLNEEIISGSLPLNGYKVKGWIGAVEKPSHLTHQRVNNNKVSILVRGKMAQEDILETFAEGGIYFDYLIGELKADFLDTNDKDDIATSSRQKINEDDPRYKELKDHTYKVLKNIQRTWTALRKEHSKKVAIKKAENINPAIKEWYDELKTDSEKGHALDLFSTIETMHYDEEEEGENQKRELYKYGILAFEKLKLRRNLGELKSIQSPNDVKLASIFSSLTDIEANLYYDIAYERVAVIKKFQEQLNNNDKEKLLQEYLFDNLWLLNPSWERPTSGSEIMEQRVETEFDKVVHNLSDEEKKGRLDIKYRTAAGKHVIVELKRYNPTYKITPNNLYVQVKKYKSALEKCLQTTEVVNGPIEVIVVLGKPFDKSDYEEAKKLLDLQNARIIYYDSLIQESLNSYSDYLEKQKQVSKIREIIDKI